MAVEWQDIGTERDCDVQIIMCAARQDPNAECTAAESTALRMHRSERNPSFSLLFDIHSNERVHRLSLELNKEKSRVCFGVLATSSMLMSSHAWPFHRRKCR
jgi:hypothetical protein